MRLTIATHSLHHAKIPRSFESSSENPCQVISLGSSSPILSRCKSTLNSPSPSPISPDGNVEIPKQGLTNRTEDLLNDEGPSPSMSMASKSQGPKPKKSGTDKTSKGDGMDKDHIADNTSTWAKPC
jgi:hypothetical protein